MAITSSSSVDLEKQIAARRAVEFVENDMIVGLGTGSTVAYALQYLGERVKSGLRIKGIPTSNVTAEKAKELGIPLIDFKQASECDITIDGADEVSQSLDLMKGGGGALLREKIVASASRKFVVIVDSKKQVEKLGKFPLPVEVIPFATSVVLRKIRELAGEATIRVVAGGNPFVSDEGNYILDCRFSLISDALGLATALERIPGIVEHGLFIGYANCVVVGKEGGAIILNP